MEKCINCNEIINAVNEKVPNSNYCVKCFTELLKNPEPFVTQLEKELKER
jgi:hypothetical protein